MCGIFCSLRPSNEQDKIIIDEDGFLIISKELKRANAARGPDAQRATSIDFPNLSTPRLGESKHVLELYASELQLRGNIPIVQPHTEDGDVLCWNGEIFEGLEINPTENDGLKVFKHFHAATESSMISDIVGKIEGPYAFVFYQASSKRLYFARDPLGRRSLLMHRPSLNHPFFLLASVSTGDDDAYEFEELSTNGIYILDLGALGEPDNFVTDFHDHFSVIPRASGEHIPFGVVEKVNQSLPPHDLLKMKDLDDISLSSSLQEAIEQLISKLDRSVMLRTRDVPTLGNEGDTKVAVLFSGGIDSTMLAFFAHRHVSLDEPIDLLNVAFENPRKMQVQANGNIEALPKRRRKQYSKMMENVLSSDADEKSSYMVPDRITGLQELEELRRLCPGRKWNFVEVNIPYEESRAARPAVEAMMYPSRTVMDVSLALALYFASRGIGRVHDASSSKYKAYTSPAKVLLSGLGSDEMLGGYGRHRSVFTARGWQGVIDELQLELDRIPIRNLGRDDRIISSHGKETRHPFLSLTVVSFLAGLPVHLKLDPRMDVGMGDKTLLRLAARTVGLVEASTRKKRAMQFGSHSARMEGGKMDRRGDLMIKFA